MTRSEKTGFIQKHGIKLSVLAAFTLIITVFFLIIDLNPDLSHLKIKINSGSVKGNYYAIARKAAEIAARENGKIENIQSKGSLENIKRLKEQGSKSQFSIVQDGMTAAQMKDLQLIARLPFSETVFFLGKNANQVKNLADLKGMQIGIGPRGSGTAQLARQIFDSSGFSGLQVKLINYDIETQINLLKQGRLDLGIFVIAENSSLIENAIRKNKLQIASLKQCRSIAKRLPYLKVGVITTGFYGLYQNLPAEDKNVLQVDTLIVSNKKAGRADIVGLLTVLTKLYPDIINYNLNKPNLTGLPLADNARTFFNNNGPELLDKYAPLLANYVPMGTLVQFVMIISILFNVMGVGNRFFLWRIDVSRVKLENEMKVFFGDEVVFDEIINLKPLAHKDKDLIKLEKLIKDFDRLLSRIRKQSQSFLVPMGKEMSYRYQENLVISHLAGLRSYLRKLKEV